MKIRDILKRNFFLEMIIIEHIKAAMAWATKHILAIKRFFLVAGSIAVVALFLAIGTTAVLLMLNDGGLPTEQSEHPISEDDSDDYLSVELNLPEGHEDDDGTLLRPPARTNFLFIGLDENLLADALMVGTFYRDSGDIHLMSIPRDMFVRIPQHRLTQMRDDGFSPPQTLKITEMRPHGGRLHGIYYMKAQIEEMLGIDFDFYVEVELEAFRAVVDAIGGVYMTIPRRLFYTDPTATPPLVIDVPAGHQLLDGNLAEGVVRYRQWPMGDLQRNEMQKEFMTQLIQQATTREALLNDPMEMLRIFLNYVRTNAGLYAVRYIPFIPNVTTESVQTFTMPGTLGYVGVRNYFFPDAAQLPATISQVFFADI
ncbi:MAG: LCP family protein [Defluviitaleaceae bacterium]|nr:LCP family protein [Defluviitaleaceae bacterium]